MKQHFLFAWRPATAAGRIMSMISGGRGYADMDVTTMTIGASLRIGYVTSGLRMRRGVCMGIIGQRASTGGTDNA